MRSGRRRDCALLLGLIAGIGLMAKWSFLLVVLSLGIALAVTPESRARCSCSQAQLCRSCLSRCGSPPSIQASSAAAPCPQALSLDQALQGVAALVTGIPLVFLPWIAFVLFFAWRFPKKPPSPPTPSHAVAIRLASLTAIVTLGLMAALLLAAFATGGALFGVSGFAIHCLFPFSLFAALALAGLIAQRVEEHRFAQRLAIISFGLALVIFLVKHASFYVVPGRSEANNLLSYARPRHGVIRDAVAARCRQSGYLFA
jgi:hypothetical protein